MRRVIRSRSSTTSGLYLACKPPVRRWWRHPFSVTRVPRRKGIGLGADELSAADVPPLLRRMMLDAEVVGDGMIKVGVHISACVSAHISACVSAHISACASAHISACISA